MPSHIAETTGFGVLQQQVSSNFQNWYCQHLVETKGVGGRNGTNLSDD